MSRSWIKGLSRADRKIVKPILAALTEGERNHILEASRKHESIKVILENIKQLLEDDISIDKRYGMVEELLLREVCADGTNNKYAFAMSTSGSFDYQAPAGTPYGQGPALSVDQITSERWPPANLSFSNNVSYQLVRLLFWARVTIAAFYTND